MRAARWHVNRAARAAVGQIVRCNLCGWWGNRFLSDNFHPGTVCPRCDAHLRHRLLAAALCELPEVHADRLVAGRSVLHFAPETAIAPLLRDRAATYRSADFLASGYEYEIDLRLDITDMKALDDASLDLVVACDVLEHVPDDHAALREIHRVLAPGGWAVLTVPQKDGLDETFEDWTATTEEARERLFGQRDHLRIYGDNFASLVEAVGYRVVVADESVFPRRFVRRHVLFPPELSTHPLATNHRKVFFAQRL